MMTTDEFDQLVEQHGFTYAAWEGFSRAVSQWEKDHEDDDRSSLELLNDPKFMEWFQTC